MFLVGVRAGTFSAGDTDPYGYVSEAELIAAGTLRVDQRFALTMPWRDAELSLMPPAYKRATVEGFIVPVYPVGLPAVMATLRRVSGNREAVFYAVPLLGALAVWATARLGTRMHSRMAGAVAAILLATSPSFLYQVTQPVSDIPAAAWWTIAVALALHERAWSAGAAGVAASMAILTRPSLVPLAAVIGGFYASRLIRAEIAERRGHARRLVLFVAGVAPGCLVVVALNDYLYGSPLRTGYPPVNELYAWAQVMPNLDRYPRWLLQTQTPFICLGVLAPLIVRRAWVLLVFAGVVCLSCLPFGVFGRDEWTYLRFLLPAYPPLLVLSVIVAIEGLRRVATRKAAFVFLASVCFGGLALWQAREAVTRGAFITRLVEKRYVDVGRFIAAGMPRDAVFVAGLHAGSIRYYAGHLTVSYPRLHFRALDQAVEALSASGHRVYFLLEEGEEADFRWRFETSSDLGRLDWPPALQRSQDIRVRIYDPADRQRFHAGEPIVTHDIDLVQRPIVTQK